VAIHHLINNQGDAQGAFDAADRWATDNANAEIREWLELASKGVDVGYYPQAGFAKYAFAHAFRHLLRKSPYAEAVRETLAGGGDTDTNVAIVGDPVGARVGRVGIPQNMIDAVLNCDPRTGTPRPEFLQTRFLTDLMKNLVPRHPLDELP